MSWSENDLKLPMPAKRRYSCLPGLLQSDSANIGKRNSVNRHCNKMEPCYPISIYIFFKNRKVYSLSVSLCALYLYHIKRTGQNT